MAPVMSVARLLTAAICAIGHGSVAVAEASPRMPIEPSFDSARDNAHLIFNAIHSAGRQWGSSVNHNGFGFFSAVMPKGTLLYHGSRLDHPPPGPEWLAFEVEHSENFARSFKVEPGGRRPPPNSPAPPEKPHKGHGDDNVVNAPGSQKPLSNAEESPGLERGDGDDGDDEVRYLRGYLHTYRANRDLNLLYVDGMSAGKTGMGTLDTQDLVLRGNRSSSDFWEWERATSICNLITEWGYDGLMRMEIGFEVIYCNFTSGVDLVSRTRTVVESEVGKPQDFFKQNLAYWARAVGERYDGLGGDRVRIDFSSMVSGLFFPINISSTDPDRPDLLRLSAASDEELKDIKDYLHGISQQSRRFTVNWQALVDMIVARFSERLAHLGSTAATDEHFISEVEVATLTYYDAPPLPGDIKDVADEPNGTALAISRCREHYFLPVIGGKDEWDLEDELIHTALDTVLDDLCSSLFAIRAMLVEATPDSTIKSYRINKTHTSDEMSRALNASRGIAQDLIEELAWTDWQKPRRCAVDEVFFIAMWPFGDKDDHWNPGCRSFDDMEKFRSGYWRPDHLKSDANTESV